MVDSNSTLHTTFAPKFDQYHIVLATIKYFQSQNTKTKNKSDHTSLVLLSQKHIYNGVVFELYEIYGIEHHQSKISANNLNDRRKTSAHKKTLNKVITAPAIVKNESSLYTNSLNR